MSLVLYAVAFGICCIAGAGAIPAYIYLAGAPVGRNLLGTGMFILGQLAHGGTMIYHDGTGNVDLLPLSVDDRAVYDPETGEWQDLDEEEITTYRFGWAAVAFDTDAEKAAPQSVRVDSQTRQAVADGGAQILEEQRGGMPLATDVPPDQPAINYLRYLKLQGRNGNQMISRAKENALEEFGGGSDTSQMVLMLLLLGGFVLMFGLTFGMLLVM